MARRLSTCRSIRDDRFSHSPAGARAARCCALLLAWPAKSGMVQFGSRGVGLAVVLLAASRLDQAPQHLGNAPSLGDAAAGRVRRFSVKNFADRADAGLGKVFVEVVQQLVGRVALAG